MTCILMIFDSSLEFRNTRYIFSIMHKYLSAHIFERYFFNCFSWFDGKPLHQPSELFGCEAFNYKSFDPVRSSSAQQLKRPCRCGVLYDDRSENSGKAVYTIPKICSATYYVYFRKPNCVIHIYKDLHDGADHCGKSTASDLYVYATTVYPYL